MNAIIMIINELKGYKITKTRNQALVNAYAFCNFHKIKPFKNKKICEDFIENIGKCYVIYLGIENE